MDKDEWSAAAQSFESSLMILRKDKNGWVIGFSVHPDEAPRDLLDAPLGTRFQAVLFEIGDDEKPVPTEETLNSNAIDFEEARKTHDPVVAAGRLCRHPHFQGWMLADAIDWEEEKPNYDAKKIEAMTADRLREILGIGSRSELRKNPEAKKKFQDLQERFRSFQVEEELEFPFME
ncbi:MAG: hypothetical protein CME21_21465 [Gemmatimonadetes bacterium]|nr:hypothetical protein [Gemmatimonadota bacterium]